MPTKIEEVNIDSIIDAACKDLKLPPTNLSRGELVADAVSTGSLTLDLILGGGWAPGRRSNVFGREQAGKSTLLYHAVKACIDQKIHVIFYDWEGSTDGERIGRMGIKHDWKRELKAKKPVLFRYFDRMEAGEQMFDHCHHILQQLPDREEGPVQMAFFLDSLPTVVPQLQRDDNKTTMAALAGLYSKELRRVKSLIAAKRCIWIDTNQLRTTPGKAYGNPEYEPCGEAVRTQSDCRVKAKKTVPTKNRGLPKNTTYHETEAGWNHQGEDKYNFAHLFVVKNKAFSPFRDCTLRIWYERAGEPLGVLDPVFDVYEYLRLTNQISYDRQHFTITIPEFNEERLIRTEILENGVPKHDPKTGEVLYKEEKRATWRWREFKSLVLDPEQRKAHNIIKACREQINDKSGFRLYFDAIVVNAA